MAWMEIYIPCACFDMPASWRKTHTHLRCTFVNLAIEISHKMRPFENIYTTHWSVRLVSSCIILFVLFAHTHTKKGMLHRDTYIHNTTYNYIVLSIICLYLCMYSLPEGWYNCFECKKDVSPIEIRSSLRRSVLSFISIYRIIFFLLFII